MSDGYCLATPRGYEWLPPRCRLNADHRGPHLVYGTMQGGMKEYWLDVSD